MLQIIYTGCFVNYLRGRCKGSSDKRYASIIDTLLTLHSLVRALIEFSYHLVSLLHAWEIGVAEMHVSQSIYRRLLILRPGLETPVYPLPIPDEVSVIYAQSIVFPAR